MLVGLYSYTLLLKHQNKVFTFTQFWKSMLVQTLHHHKTHENMVFKTKYISKT